MLTIDGGVTKQLIPIEMVALTRYVTFEIQKILKVSIKFIIDDSVGTAVPQDDRFWEDLFKNASAWGLEVYLQDWLDVETNHMSIFEEDLEVERNWLLQMGAGAARNDINILYCMSYRYTLVFCLKYH